MKKFVSTLLGLLFVVIVVCGVFVCTYIFNKPTHDRGTDSREFIAGYWTDESQNIRITFTQTKGFKITEEKDTSKILAKGYYKIDEDNKKIKLMVLPKDRDKSLKLGEKLGFFTTITYRNLDYEAQTNELGTTFLNDREKKEIMNLKASCKFIFSNCDTVFNCNRTRTVLEFLDGNGDEEK